MLSAFAPPAPLAPPVVVRAPAVTVVPCSVMLPGVPPGTYRVQVSAEGQRSERTVTLQVGQTASLDLAVGGAPTGGSTLGTVVVTGTLERTTSEIAGDSRIGQMKPDDDGGGLERKRQQPFVVGDFNDVDPCRCSLPSQPSIQCDPIEQA